MTIRTKKDIQTFLKNFTNKSNFDEKGDKYYFVFNDKERAGKWTLMGYKDGTFSLHGKGETYCDEEETFLEETELITFIWKNRKFINQALKEASA